MSERFSLLGDRVLFSEFSSCCRLSEFENVEGLISHFKRNKNIKFSGASDV